jgi:hypothetical protein
MVDTFFSRIGARVRRTVTMHPTSRDLCRAAGVPDRSRDRSPVTRRRRCRQHYYSTVRVDLDPRVSGKAAAEPSAFGVHEPEMKKAGS